MNFKQLLKEKIRFRFAKDSDFPGGRNSVIVFKPDETYELHGRTHSLESHALKHLGEFRPDVMKTLIDKAIGIIKNDKVRTYMLTRGMTKRNNNLSNVSILNMLDLINDKIVENQKLLSIEEKMIPVIDEFGKAYEVEIKNFLKAKSIDVDKLNANEIKKIKHNIKFTDNYFGNEDINILNLKRRILLIRNIKGEVLTFYKMKNKESLKRRFISKNLNNSFLKQFFNDL